jgi:hypothetical protein
VKGHKPPLALQQTTLLFDHLVGGDEQRASVRAHKGQINSTHGFQAGAVFTAELTNVELVAWERFKRRSSRPEREVAALTSSSEASAEVFSPISGARSTASGPRNRTPPDR